MKYYRCDLKSCNKEGVGDPEVELRGFQPSKEGGLLLPEYFRTKHFCSRECFVKWMQAALEQQ